MSKNHSDEIVPNGKVKDSLRPFVFPTTGRRVTVRNVNPLLAMEIRKQFPKPRPPLQEVDYGEGRVEMEPNPAHPDYEAAVSEWEALLTEKMQALLIKRGVDWTLTEEEKTEVIQLRREMEEDIGLTLPGNDTYVYVSFICIASRLDMDALAEAVMNGQPTARALEAARDTFPGDV